VITESRTAASATFDPWRGSAPHGLDARVQELAGLVRRWLLLRRRERFDLFLTLLLPVLWLLFFGLGVGRIADRSVLGESRRYVDFVLPAVVVMTAVSSGISGAVPLLWDKETGVLQRLMSMPIARGAVLTSRYLVQVALGVAQTLLVLGIGRALGVHVEAGFVGVLVVVVTCSLLIVALTSVFCALAYGLPGHGAFFPVATATTFPLVLTSNAFVPLSSMPDWMEPIARVNPITHAISPMRTVLGEGLAWDVLTSLAIVAGFAAVCLAAGVLVFRHVTDERAP
jgi:ABC-2 type transport system permease protein